MTCLNSHRTKLQSNRSTLNLFDLQSLNFLVTVLTVFPLATTALDLKEESGDGLYCYRDLD